MARVISGEMVGMLVRVAVGRPSGIHAVVASRNPPAKYRRDDFIRALSKISDDLISVTTKDTIKLKNGSRIIFLDSSNIEKLKGLTLDSFIVDESVPESLSGKLLAAMRGG